LNPITFFSAYFAARDQDDKGRATLRRINGNIEGYDVDAEYAIVKNTILEERAIKASMGLEGGGFKDVITSYLECLKGVNLVRTDIPCSRMGFSGAQIGLPYSGEQLDLPYQSLHSN
jgi:hypothetical protein